MTCRETDVVVPGAVRLPDRGSATTMALLLATLVIGSCATKTNTGAAVGAGSGALLGAGIGALLGGGQGAVVGAGVGAVAGAGTGAVIGHYMDKQEKALKDVKGAKVERKGDQLVVKFDAAILFDAGKADLKPKSQQDLGEFARVLKEYKDTDLVIEGHTDNTGGKKKNQKLSEQRAEAVVKCLESHGVQRLRLRAQGLADSRPVADNASADGRMQNRRVEVQIAANQDLQKADAQNAAQASPGGAGAQPAAAR